jgi:hypothetical protein
VDGEVDLGRDLENLEASGVIKIESLHDGVLHA